jgi:penicillin-binding protein 1A
MQFIKGFLSWIFSHKKIVFLYLPFCIFIVTSVYVLVIYLQWHGDRTEALTKLARYKHLIDKTEDMKKGLIYSSSDVDTKAKVVDLPTRIYDRNDQIIGEFFDQKREIVPFSMIPQWVVKGVIASEDRDFYKHKGISFKGIFRAMVKNVVSLRISQGGSTITQQLAKVLFTDMERSIKRKVYEAFCAKEIEKRYDKQDILSMYLNLIYFGNGAYGVEATAKMYFGTSVKNLDEVECAMIVATISNPSVYSPLSNMYRSVLKTRRILISLVDAGYLGKKRAQYKYKKFLSKWTVAIDKKNKKATSEIGKFLFSSYRINRAPFFNELIRRRLVEKFGEKSVKKGGLRVYTTIDADKQDLALASLRKAIKKQRKYHLKRSLRYRNKKRSKAEKDKAKNIEGALISINPYSGEIITYVGGSRFTVKNQNDHVSQIRRQPGSSIKPIIYATAIEGRVITPASIIKDEKVTFKGGYSPKNYDKKHAGNITVRDALCKSVNVVAVKILKKSGYTRPIAYMKKALDLSSFETSKRFGKTLSLALGAYELSPFENVTLHSVLVNGGDYVKPWGIKYVKNYSGSIIWNNEDEIKTTIEDKRKSIGKIIDPIAAAITVNMLQGMFKPGGTASWVARRWKMPYDIAGKTGTTSNYIDAWFLGYTSKLVTAVWIGNKAGAISMGPGHGGSGLAAPVWAEFTYKSFRYNKPGPFNVPEDGITREDICLDTGKVANKKFCPRIAQKQIFYMRSEPGEYCQKHKGKINDGK